MHSLCVGDTHKLGQHQQIALILDLAQFVGGKLVCIYNLFIFMETDIKMCLSTHTFFLNVSTFVLSLIFIRTSFHVHNTPLPEAGNSFHDVR